VRAIAVLAPLLAACSSSPSGTLQLVTGPETDTFTRSPAPTTLRVDAIDSSNQVTTLATARLPTTSIDLGTQDENAVATLVVSGLDDSGARLVYGASIPLQYGSLDGITVPIFVQRTGELARMPGPLSDSRQAPSMSSVQGQYIFVGGGNDPTLARTTQFYDFAQLAPFSSPPTVPRAPQSIAFVGTMALIIDDKGGTYFDFSSNSTVDVQAPPGGSFADVAGGQTIVANDGTEYVVGATRTTGAETASVLIINPNDASTSATQYTGKLTWGSLSAPRFGAAAVWVTGRGLVVAGGSTSAPGIEVVPALPSTKGVALAYPPDASMGAGATTLDTQHVLLAGGLMVGGQDAGARSINLACTPTPQVPCMPDTWSALPVPIGTAQAFAIDAANAIVAGSEAGGMGLTHVFRLTSTAAKELPTKVPHYNARALLSPIGTMLVVGGASEIESFAP
jgi:hypothetical protein